MLSINFPGSIVKISVIIPIYNVEKFIERSLCSIFSQTMTQGVEFILVNDCTPDNSMLLVDSLIDQFSHLRSQIKVITHETNRGSAATRQTGLDNATGEFIINFDSDDWCEATMLEDLYSKAIESKADIVVCDYFVNYSKKEFYVKQNASKEGIDCIRQLLSGLLHGSLCNKLISKKLYVKNSITFIDGVNLMEDFIVCIKLFFYANYVVYLPKAYYHYLQLNENALTRKISAHSLMSIQRCVIEVDSFFRKREISDFIHVNLSFLKLSIKSVVIQTVSKFDQKKYILLYPETNKLIFAHPSLPIYYKIALWASTNNFLFISNLIYNIIRKLKKYQY